VRRRRRTVWVISAVVGTIVVLFGVFESSYSYYWQAQRSLLQNPSMCVELADRAIMKAGGDYPQAQLLQCQALAALGECGSP
jgi:hypothetical protein